MTMDNPGRERRAARDEVIEYIAWFRCEYDSRAKTSDEDRDFARNLLEWLDADDLTVTPTDAASAAAGSVTIDIQTARGIGYDLEWCRKFAGEALRDEIEKRLTVLQEAIRAAESAEASGDREDGA